MPNSNNQQDEIIEWLGYDEGAIVSTSVKSMLIDSTGNTWVLSNEGHCFNTHPMQHECGWKPKTKITCSSGCYPIRWAAGGAEEFNSK